MYDARLVQPMRDETVAMGLEELTTVAEVDAVFANHSGTALVLVNSVCGCAAGTARPALKHALSHGVTPDKVYSVFAGMDKDATQRARSYFGEDFQPSSPSMNFRTAGPTETSSPSESGMRSIRSPFTFVPQVEPRSRR